MDIFLTDNLTNNSQAKKTKSSSNKMKSVDCNKSPYEIYKRKKSKKNMNEKIQFQVISWEKFDKEGLYVKKWVPELKNVPKKFIHKPWELKNDKIIKLGSDYPEPIVIHEKARLKALNAFKKI